MQVKTNTTLEHIIAKIDNDFNPDNSDWIPRVAAWCIDAMSQLDVLRTEKVRKKLIVKDNIVYSKCDIGDKFKLFDKNGCEIKEANSNDCGCSNSPSTGKFLQVDNERHEHIKSHEFTPDTIDCVHNSNPKHGPNVSAIFINGSKEYRYNVVTVDNTNQYNRKTYVKVSCNKLELNFDTDFVYAETDDIETYHSDTYNCDLPVIPNNGLLIEAIAYYCIYKMLCRGYNHPVFNLKASQYGTNPYYEWIKLKDEARRSVIASNTDGIDEASKLFRSNLFIQTFYPRD